MLIGSVLSLLKLWIDKQVQNTGIIYVTFSIQQSQIENRTTFFWTWQCDNNVIFSASSLGPVPSFSTLHASLHYTVNPREYVCVCMRWVWGIGGRFTWWYFVAMSLFSFKYVIFSQKVPMLLMRRMLTYSLIQVASRGGQPSALSTPLSCLRHLGESTCSVFVIED